MVQSSGVLRDRDMGYERAGPSSDAAERAAAQSIPGLTLPSHVATAAEVSDFHGILSGTSWANDGTPGVSVVVTFSFATGA